MKFCRVHWAAKTARNKEYKDIWIPDIGSWFIKGDRANIIEHRGKFFIVPYQDASNSFEYGPYDTLKEAHVVVQLLKD
jgi:hypothetical protein